MILFLGDLDRPDKKQMLKIKYSRFITSYNDIKRLSKKPIQLNITHQMVLVRLMLMTTKICIQNKWSKRAFKIESQRSRHLLFNRADNDKFYEQPADSAMSIV